MDDLRTPIRQSGILIRCLSLILMISVTFTHGKSCHNRMDLIIAVDTTSSQIASSFENVKTEVKGIVSGFTIGQHATRLALISISRDARVVVNFNGVNSLSDFNTAVDSLTFSTGISDLSGGIKVAKDSVLNTVRVGQISKVLILVKDRRSADATVPDTAVLSRVTSEAAAVKALGAAIQAIGIGGLWKKLELNALYGTDYLLFKDKSKALESAKSLGNIICEAVCPEKGTTSTSDGLCYQTTKHIIKTQVDLATLSTGLSVCRRKIGREFASCRAKDRCNTMDRNVGACGSDGKVTIQNTWKSFDYKLQSCVTTKSTHIVACTDAKNCPGQVADVIFVLDRSSSIWYRFPLIKEAVRILVDSMNIGADNVRVGIVTYSFNAKTELAFGSILEKSALLRAIEGLSNNTHGYTYTDMALEMARETFARSGRTDVAKFVFVITDGKSSDEEETFAKTALLKNAGVTIYAIGVGNPLESELKSMTAPETETNMLIVKDFNDLESWIVEFSKRTCIQMSSPNPKLCDDNVFVQSVSVCTEGKQQVTKTEYRYSVSKKCIKAISNTVLEKCKSKCTDPIDGNEYIEGTSWTNLCHQFKCSGTVANPFVPQESKCLAADGTCKDVGSSPFKCKVDKDVEVNNCQCVNDNNGKPVLLIETE